MEKCTYPSDLSDKEWRVIEPYFRDPRRRGGKRKWGIRLVLNAIFYVLKTGCQWRYLPKDFPPWQTVFYHFRFLQSRQGRTISHPLTNTVRRKGKNGTAKLSVTKPV